MLYIMLCIQITFLKTKVRVDGLDYLSLFSGWTGAIIGDGDRKRGIHAAPSKKTNVLFLEKIAPPSTS